MAGLSVDRPSEVVLAARVARQFYLEGVSKIDIATGWASAGSASPGCSTRPARPAWSGSRSGCPAHLNAGLSAELCSAFGLKHAFAFDFPDQDEPTLRGRLGEAAGQALMDIVTPEDVLGMSWSRSLSELTAAVTRMPPCPIVQLTGASPAGRPGPARPGPQRRPIGGGPRTSSTRR